VAAWRDTLQQAAPDQMFQHMADAFTLMSAAGIAVGDDQWRSVMGEVGSHTAMAPDPGYSAMLIRASGQGRRGETILLAALMVGKDGVAKMDLAAVADIVSALRQIGLTQEARNFAVEVAVQVGL
jgi:hypothetical protein